ncbi:hypothetical protein RB195_005329 [Necator americanus]|uniref:Uncharacterized protein n=1 Tax=Necator americanus TaxID=51031 RepID=A0ABR1BQR8_NECAM
MQRSDGLARPLAACQHAHQRSRRDRRGLTRYCRSQPAIQNPPFLIPFISLRYRSCRKGRQVREKLP